MLKKSFYYENVDFSPIEINEYDQGIVDAGFATHRFIAKWGEVWPAGNEYTNPPINIYAKGNTVKEAILNLFERLKKYPDIKNEVLEVREKIEAQIGPLEIEIETEANNKSWYKIA